MSDDRTRAAALADEIERDDPIILHHGTDRHALIVTALRAYAASPAAPKELRYEVREAMLPHLRDSVALDYAVDAALSAICANHAIVPRQPNEAAVA